MIEIKKLSPTEWKSMAENAHLVCFNEKRPAEMDRISYTLLAVKNGTALAYVTARETDSESVYLPYGGSFPGARNTADSYNSFLAFVDYFKQKEFKRVNFLVESKNKPMLKFAISADFEPIGMRVFNGQPLFEFMKTIH